MARIREQRHYSDTRAELAEYKDAYHGAVEDAFWDEDELVDYRPSSKAKKKYPRGCKGNNNKAHVYVWVPWRWSWSTTLYEEETCCGCDKRKGFRRIK
jgi:hypothetical protein